MSDLPVNLETKLVMDGSVYLRSRCTWGKSYWDCNRLHQKLCTVRLVTTDFRPADPVIVVQHPKIEQAHAPNREEGEAEIFAYK